MSAATSKGRGRVSHRPSQQQLEEALEAAKRAEAEAEFWKGVASGTSHPTQVKILNLLRNDFPRSSPSEMSKILEEPLGNVSYHTKELRDAGLIEEVDNEPCRGALKHIYALTEKGRG